MNILYSIEWISFWMNILYFVLNWFLIWIIFWPYSMKKWFFKKDRPPLLRLGLTMNYEHWNYKLNIRETMWLCSMSVKHVYVFVRSWRVLGAWRRKREKLPMQYFPQTLHWGLKIYHRFIQKGLPFKKLNASSHLKLITGQKTEGPRSVF